MKNKKAEATEFTTPDGWFIDDPNLLAMAAQAVHLKREYERANDLFFGAVYATYPKLRGKQFKYDFMNRKITRILTE